MKRINYKLIFIALIGILLFLSGCEVNTEITVNDFELKDSINNIYQKDYSNDIEYVNFENIISVDKKAKIKYYLDEEETEEVSSNNIELYEGDNYLYCIIDFGNNNSQTKIILNFYRLKLVTISFDTNCKTKVDSIIVEEKSYITAPDVELKKNGYAFVGWDYKFNRPVTKDTEIKAIWKANSYTVTYDVKGGTVENNTTIVTYGEPYKLETPVREGYIFKGWKYNNNYMVASNWLIAQDVTLIADWEAETRTYEIEYIIVGCTGANLQWTYTNKERVILRTPYKNGYKFVGWYFEGDFSGERVYELPEGTEGNIVLYSKWEKFNLEGSKISFLGDSISTFYSSSSTVNSLYSGKNEFYYPIYSSTVTSVNQTWWYQVVQETKTSLVANDSWSGSSCYNNGNESNSGAMNYNRINNLVGSDIVVVFIGTNDNVNGFSNVIFEKAYSTMIKRIKEKCPDAFIFCCTSGYSAYKGYFYTEQRRIDFNEIIRTIAKDNDACVIEISDIQTTETYKEFLGDSLHPNATGMQAYAKKASETIKNYVGA